MSETQSRGAERAPQKSNAAPDSRGSSKTQFKRELAGLSMDQQVQRLRPPPPREASPEQETTSEGPVGAVQLTPGAGSGAGSTGGTTTHPKQADLDHDKAKIKPVANLAAFKTAIKSLKVIAKAASVTSVANKIDKFEAAVTRTKLHLVKPATTGYGPSVGATKIQEWITNRIAIVQSYLSNNYTTKAQAAHDKILASGTVNDADKFDPDWGCLVDFGKGKAAFEPEEAFKIGDLTGIKGVFKVYDVGKVFNSMKQVYKDAWTSAAGTGKTGQQLFISECKSLGRIAFCPAGKGRVAPFNGANATKVFSGKSVSAFVGLQKDATASSFSDALVKYQLKASYYPSGAMLACSVGEAVLKANWGSIQLGKPSIMNLLVFDENVYDETDRTYGHLADPRDPNKPGANLELTIVGMPMADFMRASGTSVLT